MREKRRLSAADRRAQLLAIGRKVFAKSGYEAGAIDDIARAAGVSKPIVYEHFGSKEGLYAAIVEREMDALVETMAASISQGSARSRFESAVLAFLTYVKDEPDGFAVLTRDSPTSQARRGLTRVIDDLADRVGDIFSAELKRAGFSSKVSPIYAHALVGMVTQVGQWWAKEKRAFSVEDVARHVASLGWMGMRHLPKVPAPLRVDRTPVTRRD